MRIALEKKACSSKTEKLALGGKAPHPDGVPPVLILPHHGLPGRNHDSETCLCPTNNKEKPGFNKKNLSLTCK